MNETKNCVNLLPSMETLISRNAKICGSGNITGTFENRMKRIGSGYKLIKVLFGRRSSAYTVVNIAADVEFRFGAVVLITEKVVFNVAYEEIGVAGSHFGTHGMATPLICL